MKLEALPDAVIASMEVRNAWRNRKVASDEDWSSSSPT